jgi:3-phenylpropionate/cinnamic acid dioxygenase small subunit
MDIREIGDRLEIMDLLARYARGVDTKDWALWREVFTEDAHIDYRSAGGIEGDRETVALWLETNLSAFPMTQHYVTNIEIEVDGDTGRVRAMFYNPMRLPGADELSYCGGYYHHRLVRTPAGWRSRELREENAWFVNPPVRTGRTP